MGYDYRFTHLLSKKGDHFILQNDVTDWEIDGQLEMIVT